MSEQVNESWRYDVAPEAAFRMLTRLDHLTEQAEYLGYERFAVRELREREGLFRVSAERLMPEGRRSRSLRALIRHTQLWQPPAWDGARRFDAVAEFGGSLTVTGTGQLQPARNGTRYSMRLTVHSQARLFGRQVEREVALALITALEGEHRFREQWLAGRSAALGFPDQRCA